MIRMALFPQDGGQRCPRLVGNWLVKHLLIEGGESISPADDEFLIFKQQYIMNSEIYLFVMDKNMTTTYNELIQS